MSAHTDKDNVSVQVAVRIRPLVQQEIDKGCRNVLEVFPAQDQIQICSKAFSFNYVFDVETTQGAFYNKCISGMLENLFNGYNVTILAYGQTGSGKTHSMGTAYSGNGEMGVIPRAVQEIFAYIEDNFTLDFTLSVSFMELYQLYHMYI